MEMKSSAEVVRTGKCVNLWKLQSRAKMKRSLRQLDNIRIFKSTEMHMQRRQNAPRYWMYMWVDVALTRINTPFRKRERGLFTQLDPPRAISSVAFGVNINGF